MTKNIFSKFVCVTLLALINISIDAKHTIVNASSSTFDEKIYCEINNSMEFENDTVIVVMDKLLSEKNKIHSIDFFGANIIESIKDLTTGEVNFAGDDFEQVLELTLYEKNKDNVLDTIEILQQIDGIKYVGPNRIYNFTQAANDTYYVNNSLWGVRSNRCS